MKLYIAGPMTGLPEMNFPAFEEAEKRLQWDGFHTMSPHHNGKDEGTWADYVRRDLKDLLECEGIALLPGWELSRGARLEVHIAVELGMPVADVQDWIDKGPE